VRTHTSGVLTLPAYSHFRRTHAPLVVSRYPSRPACSSSRPYSHALRDLVGLLTRLAWARCSRGIRHARRGLVAVFSHALRGLVVLAVSVTPGVVSSRSSHTPCVGSLFSRYPSRPACSSSRPYSHALRDLVGLLTRLAWARCSRWGWWSQRRFTGREVGLWREIIDCVEKESPD
jgi:hypothetical protein